MKSQALHTVRNSKIHGRGVFAKKPIRKGTRIIEYTGPIVTTKEADKIGVQNENGHSHTMLFEIDKDRVINGNEGGDARYLNHGCDPNCETVQDGDRIFIEALRAIKQGEELCYDYHLQVPGKITDKERKEYACFCGSPKCRGTQIAPELLAKQAKKDEKKRKEKEKKAAEKALKAEQKAADKKKKSDKDKSKKTDKPKAKASKSGKKKDKKKLSGSLMVDPNELTKKDKKKKKNKKKK